ncbi:MAG: hypothetical protein RDU89_06995 [bacterium]|nr:hypothetical protein [bacterium]
MPLPSSILTPETAGPLVNQAALTVGVPRAGWDTANSSIRQAALDAAWQAVAAAPGHNLAGRTGDLALRLAVVVEALVRLDLAGDTSAAVRSRLAAQGVASASAGSISESYGRRPALHPATRALLQPYSGVVRLA